MIDIYDIYDVQATAPGEAETQSAVLVHLKRDTFSDGDCILFGYNTSDFQCDDDITDALQNETSETCFTTDDSGIYRCA